VAIAGITSFRIGYRQPKAQFGRQDTSLIEGWPPEVALHVVPQPSGLNAHYQVPDLARIWREVWESIDD
jgi:TDG/mug DNA glycosylase family protein